MRKLVVLGGFWLSLNVFGTLLRAQDAQGSIEHPYRGVQTNVPGVFVTPVPNAPFSATADIQTTMVLDSGQTAMRKGTAHIARDSQGRIYNERRTMVPVGSTGTPDLLSAHLFDPRTRLSVLLNPYTHLAREMVLPAIPVAPAHPLGPNMKEEDLGRNVMDGVAVHGILQTRLVPASVSTTDKTIAVKDLYWYSDDLRLNMLVKHEDPRTGTQIVLITHLDRTEPDPKLFEIPAGYKTVDETPAAQ